MTEQQFGQSPDKIPLPQNMDRVFVYYRRVNFVETDAMGVVHHANYLNFFEEARVAWLRQRKLMSEHYPSTSMCFAVVQSQIEHRRSVRFDEELKIALVARREKLKVCIRYAIYKASYPGQMVAQGETLLVPVDNKLKPVRLSKKIINKLESEPWVELWPEICNLNF